MTIARILRPGARLLLVVVVVLTTTACATRVDVFDATTAPAASEVGYRLEIRRVARSWGRLELDLNLDPSRTMVSLAPVFPQVTGVVLTQANAASATAGGRSGRSQAAPKPRTHTPVQLVRLSDDALAFRVTFDAGGIDGATDPVLQVTGSLYGQTLIWQVVVPPHRPPAGESR